VRYRVERSVERLAPAISNALLALTELDPETRGHARELLRLPVSTAVASAAALSSMADAPLGGLRGEQLRLTVASAVRLLAVRLRGAAERREPPSSARALRRRLELLVTLFRSEPSP
jgi:hypothetical protein